VLPAPDRVHPLWNTINSRDLGGLTMLMLAGMRAALAGHRAEAVGCGLRAFSAAWVFSLPSTYGGVPRTRFRLAYPFFLASSLPFDSPLLLVLLLLLNRHAHVELAGSAGLEWRAPRSPEGAPRRFVGRDFRSHPDRPALALCLGGAHRMLRT
jgi:hypothetical protein